MSKLSADDVVRRMRQTLELSRNQAEITIDLLIGHLRELKDAFKEPTEGRPIDWQSQVRMLAMLQHQIQTLETMLEGTSEWAHHPGRNA